MCEWEDRVQDSEQFKLVVLSYKPEETHWLGVIVGEKLNTITKLMAITDSRWRRCPKPPRRVFVCNQKQSSQSPPFVSPVNEAEQIK